MPQFVDDVLEAFRGVLTDIRALWDGAPLTTHILLALLMSGLGVYLGSRAERTGMSLLLFFIAFGFFTYVVMMGMSMMH